MSELKSIGISDTELHIPTPTLEKVKAIIRRH
jgi:hypothetical protein